MQLPYPVIVVPGVTGVYLRDEYPLTPEYVWTVLKKDYERVALHPDDLRYEANEPARVMPGQIHDIAYRDMLDELRSNLGPQRDKPVPVYPFSFDWRQPLESSEDQLDRFITEVIERTLLLPHYHKAGYAKEGKVNLLGHSMGGLIITGYLARWGQKGLVDKVATLATPYQGSVEAAIQIATGMANLGTAASSSREREAARLTPALYYFLPSYPDSLISAPGIPNSLFNVDAWQAGVVDSIADTIRLKGLPRTSGQKPTKQTARDLFEKMLTDGKAHRDRLDSFKLAKAGLDEKDWLAVVGVGVKTRVQIRVVKRNGKTDFDLDLRDQAGYVNTWGNSNSTNQYLTGDGTVPFEGAIPKFLRMESLVCVTPDDFGPWELRDRVLSAATDLHGVLPTMNMLQRLLVRFFAGKADTHHNTWGLPAPGVTTDQWDPPLAFDKKDG